GLAISRNIARWHGGDVKLRNAPGKTGLIAEISLPRVKAGQAGSGKPRRGEPAMAGSDAGSRARTATRPVAAPAGVTAPLPTAPGSGSRRAAVAAAPPATGAPAATVPGSVAR